jgi:hypothetical protein
MPSSKSPLAVVRTQVQFELVEVAAAVASAAAATSRAQRQVQDSSVRRDAIGDELRAAGGRLQINPALLDAMRRMYRTECAMLRELEAHLEAARQREQRERSALADLRNRERALERALQAERRRGQLRMQAQEMCSADDLWLQHAWRQAR